MLLRAPVGALAVEGEPQSPTPFLEMKQGDDEVHPQRNRYGMLRWAGDYFEGGEGKKEEEERLSHSERRGLWASGRKRKFFTAAQRQIVSFKLCTKDVRGALHGNSPDAHKPPPPHHTPTPILRSVGLDFRERGKKS